MKYLKRIFESVDEKELRGFCENYLSYLLDENFDVLISYHNILNIDFITLNLVKKVMVGDGEMMTDYKWSEVKDHILPFITMLNQNYKLNTTWQDDRSSIEVRQASNDCRKFNYNGFVSDAYDLYLDDEEISYIEIRLDNK